MLIFFVLVLLSAHVERFSVHRMQDFQKIYDKKKLRKIEIFKVHYSQWFSLPKRQKLIASKETANKVLLYELHNSSVQSGQNEESLLRFRCSITERRQLVRGLTPAWASVRLVKSELYGCRGT